jgi:NADPH:quinone reductase-like Zn-dependent oxidoreductase/NAD(P)-dependent dehydrogenase (short-subunit alcohol dehydrogenase family)
MVWGLTEGWWHFADWPLRDASPLIGLDAWEDVLRRQRFDAVTSYPRGPAVRRGSDAGMLVARRGAGPGEATDDPRTAAVRAAVGDIIECGGEVLVIRADVADAAQMHAAVGEARARFGPPDGVIHTAGILGPRLIHDARAEDIRPVFAPKAVGLLVLESVLAEEGIEPDFLILCSSLAAVAPIAGQVGYCAANAFLDAYAAHRSASGRTAALAIDWGFWQELGMIEKANMPEAMKQQISDEIREKGRTGAGIEAFRCILGSRRTPQVLVAPDDADILIPTAAMGEAGPARPVSRGVRHPWFDKVVEGTSGIACVSHFDTAHWVLDEHRPLDEAVLPGTAFLEMTRAALDVQGSGGPVEWRDVYFLSPLVVADGESREVRTILTKRDAGFDFVVASRMAAGADEWLEHARGEIAFLTANPPHPRDLAALEKRCQAIDLALPESAANGLCHGFAARVRQFTPHWRCFERVRLGADEGLATLRLAPEFAAELDVLPLHPALSDMATGYLSMLDGFEAGVPFCYRRLRLWHPLRSRVHSHVRSVPNAQPAERSYDATILDDQGTVLLEAVGLALRSFEGRRAAEPPAAAVPEAETNFCAEIEHVGSLATLGLRPAMRRQPSPGEVEIEVAAAGLNFIEVLYALGMLPDPPDGQARFGLECAGSVAAVGEGDNRFRPGDRVFGFAPSAFSRFTTAAASGIAHVPEHLSFAEAATLPVAFTTAYYALITRGRLRRGERVLIHAAAGGVGLAALNIAQWRGAEVFATAGSPEKRDYLRSRGIHHVWDSRSLDFVGQVLGASGGRGVDVVLNSLGGEFVPAGLSVLARYGRFLELGKRDILRNAGLGLAPFEKHLSFTAIDVGIDLPEFGTVWRQVARAVSRNAFRPLPYREFPISRLAAAFDHMAQARHIGKVVIAVHGAKPTISARRRGRPLDDIVGRSTDMPGRMERKPAAVVVPVDAGHSRPALATAYRPPRGATEVRVLAIWEELLGVSGIGADDNFFELRGDSLLAAQVTSRLYAALQVKLPLSSVFEHPTPAGLADRIDRARLSLRELATAPTALLAESEVEHEL